MNKASGVTIPEITVLCFSLLLWDGFLLPPLLKFPEVMNSNALKNDWAKKSGIVGSGDKLESGDHCPPPEGIHSKKFF